MNICADITRVSSFDLWSLASVTNLLDTDLINAQSILCEASGISPCSITIIAERKSVSPWPLWNRHYYCMHWTQSHCTENLCTCCRKFSLVLNQFLLKQAIKGRHAKWRPYVLSKFPGSINLNEAITTYLTSKVWPWPSNYKPRCSADLWHHAWKWDGILAYMWSIPLKGEGVCPLERGSAPWRGGMSPEEGGGLSPWRGGLFPWRVGLSPWRGGVGSWRRSKLL